MRLVFAVLLVCLAHTLVFGRPFPDHPGSGRLFWLGLSGVIGLVLGDGCLFQAYLLVGTRVASLLMSLAPVFSALLAWLFLGEALSGQEILAMSLALAGVAWVVSERGANHRAITVTRKQYTLGILLGIGGALGQALGLVTAKQALGDGYPALSAVVIRMSVAMIAIWGLAMLHGDAGKTVRALRSNRGAGKFILGGAFLGPFIGVWLSLVAVQAARVGIASTLMAMTPVILLPLVYWLFHEKISARAAAGTLLAMGGVALMFLA